MPSEPTRHVIIIGGGASGVILACHLLRHPTSDLRVTVIEKRAEVGRGVAYCTANPGHLLNVRAANMSAFPDQPDHFWHWLQDRRLGEDAAAWPACDDPFCFVPRQIYGDYIADLIAPFLAGDEQSPRLHIIQGECTSIAESQSAVTVELSDGARCIADFAVLATGHEVRPAPTGCYADPWGIPSGLDGRATVLILGSGLTMIDYVLSLLLAGHTGPIVAISRRGLLPRAHRRVEPRPIDAAEVPFGATLATLFGWFRTLVKQQVADGGDWRGAIDGVRPFTQQIWQRLPLASKHRFLEHARAWWDVHRHRMAPEVETRIAAAVSNGKLQVIAGKICAIEPNDSGALVHYRKRGEKRIEHLQVAKIVECTGIVKDPRRTTNCALRSLFDQGLARVDALNIGIDVTPECAVIDERGTPSHRLYAVGPLTRAAFWEIIAVPDIRNQCAELAARLVQMRACTALPPSVATS